MIDIDYFEVWLIKSSYSVFYRWNRRIKSILKVRERQKLSRQSIVSYFIKQASALCCLMLCSWNFDGSLEKKEDGSSIKINFVFDPFRHSSFFNFIYNVMYSVYKIYKFIFNCILLQNLFQDFFEYILNVWRL